MDETADWQRLCALLDDDEQLWPAVRDALTDGDPVEALLGGLDDAGALAYLEPEDTGMELADALGQLPRVVAAEPDLDEANDTDELDAAIRIADRELAQEELRIVRLEEPDSDAVALVVVPEESVPELVELAHRLTVPLALV